MKKFVFLLLTILPFFLRGLHAEDHCIRPFSDVKKNETEDSKKSYEFSGYISFLSDYFFNGVSNTDGEPAIQGSLGIKTGWGAHIELWGSNINFKDGDETCLELELALGHTWKYFSVTFDIGAAGYVYPGAKGSLHYEYFELYASMEKNFFCNKLKLLAALYYSPDYFGATGACYHPFIEAKYVICENLELFGSLGYQWIEKNSKAGLPDYAEWKAGIAKTVQQFTFSIEYVDADISSFWCQKNCGPTAVFSVSYSL